MDPSDSLGCWCGDRSRSEAALHVDNAVATVIKMR
jgi:hypothetical protein